MGGNPETLTNAAGVVVFEGTTSESGGSQPMRIVRLPIAWDTPNLPFPSAVAIPDIGAGDLAWWYFVSVTTAFNGSNAALAIAATAGGVVDPFGSTGNQNIDVSVTNATLAPSDMREILAHSDSGGLMPVTDPIGVTLLDGQTFTGPPGSTEGEAEIIFLVIPAS